MKEFLAYVAEDIIRKYGTDLSHIAIVFPNKRASLFLNEHLARLAGHPMWSPAYVTISDLFRQQSSLTVADPIKLVSDLHKSFCLCTGSQETLDKFYGWGQLLLSDFDDIDKNMADADRVFANLRDIHELDDISYLTDEQREMIRRFFSNFSEEHNTELKERFLCLWSHFADIYHDFNRRLTLQGLAYEGALYRQVATDANAVFEYDHYLIVGFNLLQKVEQHLFSGLQQAGKARFYWDFDHYYIHHHEAGQYIAQYLHKFPNELPVDSDEIYGNFKRAKQFTFMAAPTENIQARYVTSWLREKQRYKGGRRTAIVLCNEGLLQTIIHCLPDEVEKVNVTTGYPLSQTPVGALLQLLFNLQLSANRHRHLRAVQRHPYACYLTDADLAPVDRTPQAVINSLTSAVRNIAKTTVNVDENTNVHRPTDPLFQESLFRTYTLLNRLSALIADGDLDVDLITLQRLTSQLVQQTTIPFHGEPAEGVQVMGVLETRNLDFDHVLILSCNEGNMPRGVNDSSFIPWSIRRAYELTTVDNKVAIYTYYFHRLLQRASDVTLVYNNSTEDGQRGEMSRFMLQLMVESGHPVTQHTLQTGQTATRWQPAAIEKSERVMSVLLQNFDGSSLSPTAINKYMRCPLQFYYRYVACIKEPDMDEDDQELDNRIFGTIFHEAAESIYRQLPARIDRQLLEHLLKSKVEIERAVDNAFQKVCGTVNSHPSTLNSGGLYLINREVIIHYLRQLITIDMRLAPFTIIDLEYDVYRPIHPSTSNIKLSIGGRVDRLDLVGEGTAEERIRVVDYKTGNKRIKYLNSVEEIFMPEKIHDHSDYYLQTFIYADIVSTMPNVQRTNVSPALFFIQHANSDEYDPTLCFGKERISDITAYAPRFNELLQQVVDNIFSHDVPFVPTTDLRVCHTCLYAPFCRR